MVGGNGFSYCKRLWKNRKLDYSIASVTMLLL
jgi:hypothetical protein